MSRIGIKPIPVPAQVKVSVTDRTVTTEGPRGKLSWTHRPEIAVAHDEAKKVITVKRVEETRMARALHGTTRTLIANMIEGCLNGYTKALEVYGVGYGVAVQGNSVSLAVGYAHPRAFELPAGVTVEIQTAQARGESEPARFKVHGVDKQAVGQFAAILRKTRPPEPYKGKGVRYADERVKIKETKKK
jgi:large subunit ribosomal protein L6